MLCSSHGVELRDFWSLRQRMALSMAAGMSAWSWGATAGAEAGRGSEKPLKELWLQGGGWLWLPSVSIKARGKE